MTIYYIETIEIDGIKVVPYKDKKYKFLDIKKANEFLNNIKIKNPDKQFRKVRETVIRRHENWI